VTVLAGMSAYVQGYIAVSEVGRMAIGSSRSELPLKVTLSLRGCGRIMNHTYARVTQATSGEKPSIWSFSRSRTLEETNIGKYAFCTPISLICTLNQSI
jgi:hypothetical protein